MTGKRVRSIQKLALLICLGALLPASAVAQELPPPPNESSGGCVDPFTAAVWTCEDYFDWYEGFFFFDSQGVCEATCKRMLEACLNNAVMAARCMDRFNKDFLSSGMTACKDAGTSAPECRDSYAGYTAYVKEEIIVDYLIEAKVLCRDCYEQCLADCS